MSKRRVVILSSCDDYWEACYIDGECVDQAHHLGEGRGKISYIKEICKKYDVTLDDVIEVDASEEDDRNAMDRGDFPQLFSDLLGEYDLDCE